MSENNANQSRRRFIKIAAMTMAAAPLANLALNGLAQAQDLPLVDENDPTAKGLQYTADGVKAGHPADAHCATCQLYSGAADAASGPCAIFPGKAVTAKGWCASYVKKA